MRDARLAKLAGAGPLVAATLVEAEVRCGNEGRRCRKGGGRPTRFLTFKCDGRTVSVYVPKHRLVEVRGWVREHRRIKALVREISEGAHEGGGAGAQAPTVKPGGVPARTLRHFLPGWNRWPSAPGRPRDPGRIVCRENAGTGRRGHGGARNASFPASPETSSA